MPVSSRVVREFWECCGAHPRAWMACALLVEALACAALCRHGRLQVSLAQFMLGAEEIEATRRIASEFLPVGYSALLGWAELAGGDRGVMVLQAGFLLAIVALVRAILRQWTSLRFATLAALLIGLYPALLVNVDRVNDTDVTLVCLLWLVLALQNLRARPGVGNALMAGTALGAGLLVRPNLAVLVLLFLWALRPLRVGRAVALALAGVAATVVVYAGFTATVHGRPFFPQNGPYNLYGGYNAHTAWSLRENLNVEDSIEPAMADAGFPARLDWRRQPDQPGVEDTRDARYAPYYSRAARAYVRAHPLDVVKLSALRLGVFLSESYANKNKRGRVAQALAVAAKSVLLLVVPVWAVMLVWSRERWWLIVWLAVLYALPFVLINADPRFRTALEGLLLMDVARMGWRARFST